MYLPRDLIALLYNDLRRTQHSQSPAVVLLVALEPDALCASRILTGLFKRDYIAHNLIPVAGYGDLIKAGENVVQPMRRQNGGSGGRVVCLGVGGLVDLGPMLGLESADDDAEDAAGGVEVWVIDARRPWNLGNVFGGKPPDHPAPGETNGNARTRASDVNFGELQQHYRSGRGGIVVFDDGDIAADLQTEREAYFKLEQLPDVDDDGRESVHSESESEDDDRGDKDDGSPKASRKRKSWSDAENGDDDDDDPDGEEPPRRRRRGSSMGGETDDGSSRSASPTGPPARRGLVSTSTDLVPSTFPQSPASPSANLLPPSNQEKPVSARRNRRRLLRIKRKNEAVLHSYYSQGSSNSEPVSSLVYSLVSELGLEDNDALWYAIVGLSSLELYGRTSWGVGISASSALAVRLGHPAAREGDKVERVRHIFRDEVRRLNPPDASDSRNGGSDSARAANAGVIPYTANSPTDMSIRLSPEPRFLLVRHWSLYDSMLHSPFLAARLHLWNDVGVKRLHKLLAKMGMSLAQARQNYTHMDMDLKKGLRAKLLKYAELYGLDGLVPPARGDGGPVDREGWGFVRSWGWKACLSAVDVAVIVSAILEVGRGDVRMKTSAAGTSNEKREIVDEDGRIEGEEYVGRFFEAYDALNNVDKLLRALPSTQHLHRAILRTGTSVLQKRQIRHLHTFRIGVIRDGPDVALFAHPGALTKLTLWVAAAMAEQDHAASASGTKGAHGGSGAAPTKDLPLVLACLNERRGVYVVVGTGGGEGGDALSAFEAEEEKEQRKIEKAKRKEERARRREERRAQKQRRKEEKKAAARAARGRSGDGEDDDIDDDDDNDNDFESDSTESEASSSESEDDDDDDDDNRTKRGRRRNVPRNKFGLAFQEVVDETGARVRIDSFEHCVVEVKSDDLGSFLESLSMKAVVG